MIAFDFADPVLIYVAYNLLTFTLLCLLFRYRERLREHDRTVRWVVFGLLAYSQVVRYGLPLLQGSFLMSENLPFQTCRISSAVLLYYLVRPDRRIHPLVFYLTATGIWGVFITNGSISEIPELTEYYFIDHAILGLTPFYLLLVKDYRPTYRMAYTLPLALLTVSTLFIPINTWLGAEYFHLGNIHIARAVFPDVTPFGFLILLNLAMFVYFNILYAIGQKISEKAVIVERPRSA